MEVEEEVVLRGGLDVGRSGIFFFVKGFCFGWEGEGGFGWMDGWMMAVCVLVGYDIDGRSGGLEKVEL